MFRLRELERRDIPEINRWRNRPELVACLGAPYRYIGVEVDEQWFETYLRNRDNMVRCAIVREDDDRIQGLISLTGVDRINHCAVLHIQIGNEAERGKGMGTFAVEQMLYHSFQNMNLHRLELEVLQDNLPAIALYEKCGFVREGVKRRAIYKQGAYVDVCIYGLLREEYLLRQGQRGVGQ